MPIFAAEMPTLIAFKGRRKNERPFLPPQQKNLAICALIQGGWSHHLLHLTGILCKGVLHTLSMLSLSMLCRRCRLWRGQLLLRLLLWRCRRSHLLWWRLLSLSCISRYSRTAGLTLQTTQLALGQRITNSSAWAIWAYTLMMVTM